MPSLDIVGGSNSLPKPPPLGHFNLYSEGLEVDKKLQSSLKYSDIVGLQYDNKLKRVIVLLSDNMII